MFEESKMLLSSLAMLKTKHVTFRIEFNYALNHWKKTISTIRSMFSSNSGQHWTVVMLVFAHFC